MRLFKKILLVAVLLVAAVAGFFVWKMGPRNVIGMLRYDQRKEGSLKVGDRAPDVSLVSLDGKSPVRISEHVGGRPLILVFGSYT
jgi:hypothetical protein